MGFSRRALLTGRIPRAPEPDPEPVPQAPAHVHGATATRPRLSAEAPQDESPPPWSRRE
jgi:hypothetical protein